MNVDKWIAMVIEVPPLGAFLAGLGLLIGGASLMLLALKVWMVRG